MEWQVPMVDWLSEYRRKRISVQDAAGLIKSGDVVDFYAFNACSMYLDEALSLRVNDLENVTIRSTLRLAPPMKSFMADSEGKAFRLEALFKGPCENSVPPGRFGTVPSRLGLYEQMYQEGQVTSDYLSFMVSPPDNDGYLHFWPSPAFARAAVEMSSCFIAEINETYPALRGGDDCKIHVSEADYIIEGSNPPLLEMPTPDPSEVDKKIAEFVLQELRDGACLQIGYGSVPNAVTQLICHSDFKDFGVQTELLPESIMLLHEAGKVSGIHKGADPGLMTAGFIMGTKRLFDFVRDCPAVRMRSVSYTNDPYVIGKNDNFFSLNSCLQVDLRGQVNSESILTHHYTGTGGQLDFVLGAQLSKGGKSILCCPSTYTDKKGKPHSRIVAALPKGAMVTTPQSCTQFVATEYGIVDLRGKPIPRRVELLTSIAHPDFRDEIVYEAKELGIIL